MSGSLFAVIVSAAAALLGAAIGAYSLYALTKRFEQAKLREAIGRLHVLILSEIEDHAAAVALELRRALPYWILRGAGTYLERFNPRRGRLNTASFDTYRSSVLNSDLALQIVFHYQNVDVTNHYATGSDRFNYIRSCIATLRSAIGTITLLLASKGSQELIARYATHLDENYRSIADWYENLLVLSDLSLTDLSKLENGESPLNYPQLAGHKSAWQWLLDDVEMIDREGH